MKETPCPHDWVVILRKATSDGGAEDVVRWCCYCGAVRLDYDFDGRTHKGVVHHPEGWDGDDNEEGTPP